ncbi:MAG: DUF4190 domain-containing protein [Ilumatobacteraceae bacterium]
MSSLPPPPPPGDFSSEPRTDRRAVAALVCGIGGLLLFGLVLGAAAIILGWRSRREITARPWAVRGMGMATSGMVLGAIDVVAYFVIVFATS